MIARGVFGEEAESVADHPRPGFACGSSGFGRFLGGGREGHEALAEPVEVGGEALDVAVQYDRVPGRGA